MSKMNTVQ